MIWLELPSERHREEVIAASAEFLAEGIHAHLPEPTEEAFDAYLLRIRDMAEGRNLQEGFVPATEFWMVDADGFAGRIQVRHRLTDALRKMGGHIGYAVRPSRRERGYATEALRLALAKAAELGVERALVTVDEVNVASRKVVERNGGLLDDSAPPKEGSVPMCRYWIETRRP